MRIVKFLFRLAFKTSWFALKLSVLAILLCAAIVLIPRVYDQHVRAKVASQVFRITHKVSEEMYGSGTGFVVRNKEGKTLVVTNRHVCERVKDGRVTLEQQGLSVSAKILMMSKDTDLCAVSAPKGFAGLELSMDYHSGERVQALGHPRGMPHTRTEGEIIGFGVEENGEKINSQEELNACTDKSYTTVQVVDMEAAAKRRGKVLPPNVPKTIQVCVSRLNVVYTTVTVGSGNSGSPMVDQDGLVKGVIMAMFTADGTYGWAIAIPLDDLNKFLDAAFKEVA